MTPLPRPGSPLRWLLSSITAAQLNGYPGDHVLTQVLAQSDVVGWIAAGSPGAPPPATADGSDKKLASDSLPR
jgi:hypothetical protein